MSRPPAEFVSVVIPVVNGRPLIDEQLQALAEQDYEGRWEVVVSDNGSTDGLREHLTEHPLRERLNLRHVDSSDRSGTSHARNVGVAHAVGDFIAYADHDDRVRPGWLSALVRKAQDFDAVSGSVDTTVINSPKVASWRPVPKPQDGWVFRGWLPSTVGASFGVWRTVHDSIGGWDESWLGGGEEHEYAWKLQLAGFTLGHSPEALVDYRLRDSYGALWRQIYGYGQGDVLNHIKFRRYRKQGFPGYHHPWLFLFIVTTLALRNPLLPEKITRLPTGRWLYYVAYEAGKIRGAIRHRVFCI